MPKRKNNNKKGKGFIGDVLSNLGKTAYYVGSKIIDPKNNLSFNELH